MTKNIRVKVIGAEERRGRLVLRLEVTGPEKSWIRWAIVPVPADILSLRVIQSLAYHAEMREGDQEPDTAFPGL